MKVIRRMGIFLANLTLGIAICFLCYKETGYLFQIKNIIVKENKNKNILRTSFLNENNIIKEIKLDK